MMKMGSDDKILIKEQKRSVVLAEMQSLEKSPWNSRVKKLCARTWEMRNSISVWRQPRKEAAEVALAEMRKLSQSSAGTVIVEGFCIRDLYFGDEWSPNSERFITETPFRGKVLQ